MEQYSCKAVIPSCPEKGRYVQATLSELVKASQLEERQIFHFSLSLEEAIVNAMKHGNGFDQAKFVTIQCDITPQEVVLIIEDEGSGFDPTAVPDPRLPEFIEEPNGRGLLLMREFMTEMQYNDRGNILTLRLDRN